MSLTRMRRKMRKQIRIAMWIIAIVFAATAVLMYAPLNGSGGQASPQQVLARVNGTPIRRSEFESLLEQHGRNQMLPLAFTFMFVTRQVWESLVGEVIREQAARDLGLRVSDREVRRVIDEEIDRVLEGVPREHRAEERDRLRLVPQLRPANVRAMLEYERMQNHFYERARPVEVRAAHILIATNENRTPEQALALARSLTQQLRTGADIVALAAEHSDDPATRESGGDLGWIQADSHFVAAELRAAALQLERGAVPENPVSSPDGYHVLQATEVRPWEPEDVGDEEEQDLEARRRAEQDYRFQVANSLQEGYLTTLRREAVIEPVAPLIKGLVLEERVGDALFRTIEGEDGQPLDQREAALLREIAGHYREALKQAGREGIGLDYHLATIYERLGDHESALAVIVESEARNQNPEMFVKRGDLLRILERDAEAIEAYQEASLRVRLEGHLYNQLAERFRELDREDLAAEQAELYEEYQQRQAEIRQIEEERQREFEELQQQLQDGIGDDPDTDTGGDPDADTGGDPDTGG